MTNNGDSTFRLSTAVPDSTSLPDIEAPRRGPVYGSRHAVASDHPMVSLVAMDILHRGGNAADAAIAAAAVNVVTKPHRTHLGGDAFMLVWRKKLNVVDCLNAGGRAPFRATPESFGDHIPETGPQASTVPGLVDALLELHKTYATLSLEVLLKPAIELAEQGFPTSPRLAGAMKTLVGKPEDETLRRTFLVDGQRPYAPGETLRQPELAETLKRIVEDEREGFYAGKTGQLIAEGMRKAGGIIDERDLEQPAAHWHEAIKSTYQGTDIYEQALPSQGIILLEALNIVENFPLAEWGPNADAHHVMIEATRLAFGDRRKHVGDPEHTDVPVEYLLSKELGRERAAQIDLKHAGQPEPALLSSDTTEFVVGDDDMAIAFIQSVFSAWGARFMIPGTGILMNNRLRGFSLDASSPNYLVPGKRTVHTLNTFMAIKDGELMVGGGTPGADFQVQSNLQTAVGALSWGRDLQSAIDSPRWVTVGENDLALEARFGNAFIDELHSRGHKTHVMPSWDATLARSQVIASRPGGGWAVASDLRGEGTALAW